MKRRDFIKNTAVITSASVLGSSFINQLYAEPLPDVVRVSGGEPDILLKSGLDAFGGMGKFISKGDVVVIKPNIGWDRAPELAANTNPDLIAALVKSCFDTGAKTVKIFDRTCNNPLRCYANSKIESLGKKYGAEVLHVRENKYKTIPIPNGEMIKEWPIYTDYLEADKVINVPIAKHHSLSYVSLGMKNLMGVMGGNRGSLHNHFPTKIVDIDSAILPTLTIIDGYRVLLRNGPVGGNPDDVALKKTLIISQCMITADMVALDLFGHKKEEIGFLNEAYKRKVNLYDPEKLNLKNIQV